MADFLELAMPNELAALDGVVNAAVAWLEERGAAPGSVYAANLTLEELVTNILKYGYDDAAAHEILIRLEADGERWRLRIEDDGHEFDPFAQPPPDTSLPLHLRPIGGLGIHFVRNLADETHYERRNGRNIVTVAKALHPPPPAE